MTAKDKAEKLFKKYISICNNWSSKFIEFKTIKELKKELIQNEWFIPKKCALIAVDLRLEGDFIFSSIEYGGEDSLEYWIEVKQEIEKL